MNTIFTYTGDNYPLYFNTPHWHKLKEEFIYSNPRAKCYICQKASTLLPHHFQYKNLFKERRMIIFLFFVFGDIAVVCFDCHTNIHFIRIDNKWLEFEYRFPIKRRVLLMRMFYLRYKYCIQHREYKLLLQSNLFYITTRKK